MVERPSALEGQRFDLNIVVLEHLVDIFFGLFHGVWFHNTAAVEDGEEVIPNGTHERLNLLLLRPRQEAQRLIKGGTGAADEDFIVSVALVLAAFGRLFRVGVAL